MCIGSISSQLLLDVADFIYIAVDVNQKVTLINKKGCEILDYSEDEIIGKNWFNSFLPKEKAKKLKASFIKRIEENNENKLEKIYPIRTKGGEERLISWHSTFYKDEEGNLSGVLCSGEDITEFTKTKKYLETSENRFREIFKHSNDGYVLRKSDGTMLEVNPKFLELFGYKREEVIGKNIREIPFKESSKELNRLVGKTGREGFIHVETEVRKKDGTSFPIELNGTTFVLDDEEVVFLIIRDLTKSKKIESGLIESEERLRNLFENIPLAISISSSNGKSIDVNPYYYKFFGYKNKEECISSPSTERWLNIADRERFYDSLRQKDFIQNFVTKRCKKDGTEFWASITAITQSTISGERIYFKTLRDITTEKQIEDELSRQTLRYHLEESQLYLSEEERPYISKEAFADLLRVGYNGLVLSRLAETKWKKDINYKFDFFRLAEKGHIKTISSDLSKIEQLIEELPSKHVIVIDRLDYLISKNGFETTLFFIFRLMDIAYLSNHIIILTLDPATINEKESRSLKKEMRMIESIAEATLPEELIEILEFVHKRNITGDKPSYTDIVEVFNISRPTARKRIKDLINEEYLFELTKGRNKVLGITPKGKSIFD